MFLVLLLNFATLQVRPLFAAEGFPGAVSKQAARVRWTVNVDLSRPGWQGTGLYAVPGEPVRIRVPAGAERLGLVVQVGAHTDDLAHLDDPRRPSRIVRSFPLSEVRGSVTSEWGGPVYVVVPGIFAGGRVPVTISGAVGMPRFMKGVTSVADWNGRLRRLPAPWAELEGDRVILTIPSDVAAGVRDPHRVLSFWDRVLAAQAELAGARPHPRRKERIVADIQISAGYMHSGYPIMIPLEAAEVIVDPWRLVGDRRSGPGWSVLHELGHNLQSDDWTFDGTREVTNNLFALYAFDRVCGIPPRDVREELRPDRRRAGAPFDLWRADPFIGLQPYVILQEEFGWEFYRRIFKAYRAMPEAARPRTDPDRIRMWVEATSTAAGRDLTAFWKRWGVTVSAATGGATRAR